MTRDEAIRVAASAIPPDDTTPWDRWAASVVAGADALLAAMGELEVGCSFTDPDGRHCTVTGTHATHIVPKPRPMLCCAATEARVVREIVSWLRADRLHITALEVERGDWRAKGK